MNRIKHISKWLVKWGLKSFSIIMLLIFSLAGIVKVLELNGLENTVLVPLIYFSLWACTLIKTNENGR